MYNSFLIKIWLGFFLKESRRLLQLRILPLCPQGALVILPNYIIGLSEESIRGRMGRDQMQDSLCRVPESNPHDLTNNLLSL